jgi:hypothetical protein
VGGNAMSKSNGVKLVNYCILIVLILGLTGCTGKGKRTIKAVYLAPENGGQLSEGEIEKYPEVIRVTSSNELEKSASKKTAIWIDKDAVHLLDSDWLQKKSESQIPIVLIGYKDALYSFREKLSGFGIEGPDVDWSQKELEPGFSVWILNKKTNSSRSAFMKGYDSIPNVGEILSITNMLLEGKFPE